ncbi:glycosyltransferase family 2 protein [Flavobacterium sp. N2820]|uniref:glycosyltransferase family 2 protein n=1 Tax=Flavobacterium sp. N2820 TaxID=2986834 RepID=UPI0022251099|nr:glycosyltransferase family 2 protein [Flavobacterium sp. N2820]
MLAIIIPFYKLTFFQATLQSLAHQTDKRFKVYVGDDASPDDCTALLQSFEGQFDFVYHRFESNLGSISLTQQWERCIALSNDEEWLMILGDDDVLGENVVEAFYNSKKNNVNVFRFSTVVIDENNKVISDKFTQPIFEKATDSFFRKINNETRSSLSEYVFKRVSYQQHKFSNFPLAWYSDDLAWIKFSDSSLIASINDSVIYFRFSNDNISGKTNNLLLKEEAKFLFFQKIVKEELARFNKNQICILLTTYEILLRNRNLLSFKNSILIALEYIKIRRINHLLKFMKRQFIKKIKSK